MTTNTLKRIAQAACLMFVTGTFLAACEGCGDPPVEEKDAGPKTDAAGPGSDAATGDDATTGDGATCPVGTEGCPCDSGSCTGSLACENGTCVASTPHGFVVSDASARACEMLLTGVSKNLSVSFDSTLQGKAVRDGDRMAVTFHAQGDATIAAGAITVQGGTPTIASSRCFDADGAAISGASVSLAD